MRKSLPTTLAVVFCVFAIGACSQNEEATAPAEEETAMPEPGTIIKDCLECPEMVVVPAGTFTMGSSPEETARENVPDYMAMREWPAHDVTIAKPFAIGRYELKRGEWAAFVADTGFYKWHTCRTVKPANQMRADAPWPENVAYRDDVDWRDPGFAQTDEHPAVCISWDDAQLYLNWLSKKTSHTYRLPTEAEWEYAARGGTAEARYFDGSDPANLCGYLNGGDADFTNAYPHGRDTYTACSDGSIYTSPVGSFAPNAYGLYDVYGNVWEWVQDCIHSNFQANNPDPNEAPAYEGAPTDGSEWLGAEHCERISRGSSWFGVQRSFRAAFRVSDPPAYRGAGVGIRIVRELP